MSARKRPFSGWYQVGVGSFCYGFGISPMYYSWGFFLPEMRLEFALSGAQAGFIFTIFSIIYHGLGPVVGVIMGRWGVRSVVGLGSAVGVLAFWLMSRAGSYSDCLIAYGILGGIAIGFSTILPAQTLASNWFVKYRARAIAFVLAGGGIVGYFSNRYFGPFVLETWSWRTGWLLIAAISAMVGVVALIFVRSRPEDLGQHPDGLAPQTDVHSTESGVEAPSRPASPEKSSVLDWSAAQAVRTYQFYVLVALSIAYGVPWGVITVFGREHLESLGFTMAIAGSILGWRVMASVVGRLSALGGDFMSPQRLLAIVLLVEGIGTLGLVLAQNLTTAYVSVVLVGLGFGAAYVTIPVTYATFYGRPAFGTTVGIRFAITGLISPWASTVAGLMYDWSGAHVLSFTVVAVICLVGSPVSYWLPHPGRAPRPALSPA